MVLRRHRLAAAIVLIATATLGSLLAFGRPQHHEPSGGKTISGTAYPPAARGWAWADGQPGFQPETGHEDWNISQVTPAEVARVEAHNVRLLAAQRLAPRELQLLFSATDATGSTCIGAALAGATHVFCPSSAAADRLGPQVAFAVVAARPAFSNRGARGYPLFVTAVTRGDVTRAVVSAPQPTSYVRADGTETTKWSTREAAYRRANWGWWGTFSYTLTDGYPSKAPGRPWRVRLDFYGRHGLLASREIQLDKPTQRLVAVTP